MMKIEFEKNPKCKICGKQIDADKYGFIMIRRKNRNDEYVHTDCYKESIREEIKKVLDLGFDSWENQLDKI